MGGMKLSLPTIWILSCGLCAMSATGAAAQATPTGTGQATTVAQARTGQPAGIGAEDVHHSNRAGPPGDDDLTFGLDDVDLDELVVRIYDRLRSRLRRELLVDRERAGLLTDFR